MEGRAKKAKELLLLLCLPAVRMSKNLAMESELDLGVAQPYKPYKQMHILNKTGAFVVTSALKKP